MLRLFLDANVLFSAAYRDGSAPALVFDLAPVCDASLLATAFVVDEARRNVALKRPEALPRLEQLVGRLALVGEPTREQIAGAAAHGLPQKDAPVLAAAIRCRASMLVTGDRTHFGHLFGKAVGGVRVVTVAGALSAMLRDDVESNG